MLAIRKRVLVHTGTEDAPTTYDPKPLAYTTRPPTLRAKDAAPAWESCMGAQGVPSVGTPVCGPWRRRSLWVECVNVRERGVLGSLIGRQTHTGHSHVHTWSRWACCGPLH